MRGRCLGGNVYQPFSLLQLMKTNKQTTVKSLLIRESRTGKTFVCDLVFPYLLTAYSTVYWILLTSTGRITKGQNKYQGAKSTTKRKVKKMASSGRWDGRQAGLNRSRWCAESSCRTFPRTPAAACRSHAPCPPCTVWTGTGRR